MERKNGNWTINQTYKKFENDFFKVFEDEVIQPDGSPGKYATIDLLPGVAVLPIDDEEFVYLTRQFRYALGEKDIEVVAGAIEGESPLESAQRELREELGIEAREWTAAGVARSITGITNSISHLFITKHLAFGEANSESTEEIEPVKMPLAELGDRVIRGEIVHGDTCILALKALFRE